MYVHQTFKLEQETLFCAVRILNRITSEEKIKKDAYELVAIFALKIACNTEERERFRYENGLAYASRLYDFSEI